MSAQLVKMEAPLLSMEELRTVLRQVGDERYHHRHPFHLLRHEGKLTPLARFEHG
jgi:pyrroloquinoline quinone (PQQ) biosynthesis protein C